MISESYADLCKKALFPCACNAIDAMNEVFDLLFPIDCRSSSNIEAGFREKSRHQCLKGCLGAIGGMHFPI